MNLMEKLGIKSKKELVEMVDGESILRIARSLDYLDLLSYKKKRDESIMFFVDVKESHQWVLEYVIGFLDVSASFGREYVNECLMYSLGCLRELRRSGVNLDNIVEFFGCFHERVKMRMLESVMDYGLSDRDVRDMFNSFLCERMIDREYLPIWFIGVRGQWVSIGSFIILNFDGGNDNWICDSFYTIVLNLDNSLLLRIVDDLTQNCGYNDDIQYVSFKCVMGLSINKDGFGKQLLNYIGMHPINDLSIYFLIGLISLNESEEKVFWLMKHIDHFLILESIFKNKRIGILNVYTKGLKTMMKYFIKTKEEQKLFDYLTQIIKSDLIFQLSLFDEICNCFLDINNEDDFSYIMCLELIFHHRKALITEELYERHPHILQFYNFEQLLTHKPLRIIQDIFQPKNNIFESLYADYSILGSIFLNLNINEIIYDLEQTFIMSLINSIEKSHSINMNSKNYLFFFWEFVCYLNHNNKVHNFTNTIPGFKIGNTLEKYLCWFLKLGYCNTYNDIINIKNEIKESGECYHTQIFRFLFVKFEIQNVLINNNEELLNIIRFTQIQKQTIIEINNYHLNNLIVQNISFLLCNFFKNLDIIEENCFCELIVILDSLKGTHLLNLLWNSFKKTVVNPLDPAFLDKFVDWGKIHLKYLIVLSRLKESFNLNENHYYNSLISLKNHIGSLRPAYLVDIAQFCSEIDCVKYLKLLNKEKIQLTELQFANLLESIVKRYLWNFSLLKNLKRERVQLLYCTIVLIILSLRNQINRTKAIESFQNMISMSMLSSKGLRKIYGIYSMAIKSENH